MRHRSDTAARVSRRALATPPSPIRKFLPLVLDAEKRGVEVLKLNVGDPDLEPPVAFLKEMRKYRGPLVPYAPSTGVRAHVEAWTSYYKTLGIRLDPRQIIPTVGCAEAIMYAFMATTDPGDDVLIFEPFYPSFRSFAVMTGISLSPVTLESKDNYALPPMKEIERKIGKRTKAIVIVNPGNPTGTVFSEKDLRMLAALAKKHGLFIISDETYRDIVFDRKPSTMLAFPDTRDRTIVIDSASKRFSLPGARIGCVASSNDAVIAAVLRFAMARLSAGTLEQFALIPLFKDHRTYVKRIVREYRRRHGIVIRELRKIPGVEVRPAHGAFYLTVRLPITDSEAFTAFLLKDFSYRGKTVALAPMTGFYWTKGKGTDAVRIAYVLGQKELVEAIRILARGIEAYNAQCAPVLQIRGRRV